MSGLCKTVEIFVHSVMSAHLEYKACDKEVLEQAEGMDVPAGLFFPIPSELHHNVEITLKTDSLTDLLTHCFSITQSSSSF